jgi:CubicO group peptidase (beta-lactamase class C family)
MTRAIARLALASGVLVSGCGDDGATVDADALMAAADGATGAGGQGATDARYQAFADHIAAELTAAGVPGGALAIIDQGRVAFTAGLGVKEAGTDHRVGLDTVFRIASTTKTFTALTAMSLAEDGALSLDAPITRYLPELRLLPPNDPSRITLRRLLSHTAGVPDYLEIECGEGPTALGDWFAAHPTLTLWSPPGRLWSYSNLGYSLAGLVTERAGGAAYRDLVEDRILEPLGLATATFDVDEVIAGGDYALAHPTDVPADATLTRCALTEPPGYLYASIRDLARFSEALLAWGEGVVAPESLIQMALPHRSTQAPPDVWYGLGLLETTYNGKRIVGHPGDLFGMHSAWWLVPGERFGVVVLVNGDGYPPTRAALQAIDAFLTTTPTPPTDWSTPPSDWQRYVGRYDGRVPAGAFPPDGLGMVEITLEAERLFATIEDGSRYELFQAARDAFFVVVDGQQVVLTFWRGLFGRAEYIATRAGAAHRTWLPAAAPRITGPAIRPAAGDNPFRRIARTVPADPLLLTR